MEPKEGRVLKDAKMGQIAMPAAQSIKFRIATCSTGVFLTLSGLPALSGDWTSSSISVSGQGGSTVMAPGQTATPTALSFSTIRDYGTFTLGAGYAEGIDVLVPSPAVSSQTRRVNLQAGVDFGHSLGYVTFGREDSLRRRANEGAESIGLGLRISLNRAIQLTGEVQHY